MTGYLKTFFTLTLLFGFCNAGVLVRRDDKNDGLTCWTCPNKTSNEECNDWAPDKQCYAGHSWCRTVHLFKENPSGATSSIYVSKDCVSEDQCTMDVIGCTRIDALTQICISCCNENYCNEPVPLNHQNALELSQAVIIKTSNAYAIKYTILTVTIPLLSLLS